MPLNSSLYEWGEGVKNAPSKSGVYALYDAQQNLIYIGSTTNIRERLLGYWSTNFADDSCKKGTTYYKREITSNYKEREKELIQRHKPKCNDTS
jgi:excinuclease UvrABC nuclease subunit